MAGVRVTFRPVDNRDCEVLRLPVRSARDSRVAPSRGHVCTINGRIVLAFDRHGQVIYQNGSAAISDLVRASMRITKALQKIEDWRWRELRR